MKRVSILLLCICLLAAAVSAVSAQDTAGYKVTYLENNCLGSVPTDDKEYKAGEYVSVLFDPVTYTNGLIFYGWDWNNDGIADFGYAYNYFYMPARDVELKAICISPYYAAPKPGPCCNPCGNPCGNVPPAKPDTPNTPAPTTQGDTPSTTWTPWVDPAWPVFYPVW